VLVASVAVALAVTGFGCAEKKETLISAVLPLTGEYSLYGQSIKNGVEVAYQTMQANPSIPAFVLNIVDSQSDPTVAKDLLEQEYTNGAIAVIGGVTTAEALKMVSSADEFGRVLISPSASTPNLTGISANFYRVFPSDTKEGATMGNFAAQDLSLEEVAILAKEDLYAKGIQSIFKTEFERLGGKVVEVIEYPEGGADFDGFIERVISLEPQGVYVAAYATDIGTLISGLRDSGFKGRILTTSAFAAPAVIEEVGDDANNVFLTQAVFEVESEDELISGFVSSYRESHGLSPDIFAAHGFDALFVLGEALKDAGSIPSDFWQSVRGLRDFKGVTGTLQFDERGDVQKFPRVYVISDGDLIDFKKDVERRRKELMDKLKDLKK